MKTSELIVELQKILDESEDTECFYFDGYENPINRAVIRKDIVILLS